MARRHQRLLSFLAFGLLAVAAELLGASLTARLDVGRHVRSPSYSHAAYYPALVAAVKVGIALLLHPGRFRAVPIEARPPPAPPRPRRAPRGAWCWFRLGEGGQEENLEPRRARRRAALGAGSLRVGSRARLHARRRRLGSVPA